MSRTEAVGYREHEHTADWELEIWAPDLTGLLEQAARGMYALAGVKLKPGHRQETVISLAQVEPEQLLVGFLNELLFLGEQQGLAFDQYAFLPGEGTWQVTLAGAPIQSQDKEIKAVTYHRLNVIRTERGLTANLVFDV